MKIGSRKYNLISPIFGKLTRVNGTQLPSHKDVLALLLLLKTEFKKRCAPLNPTNSKVFMAAIEKIEFMWLKTSIPIVSRKRIGQMLQCTYKKYTGFLKYSKSKSENQKHKEKLANYISLCTTTLFDLSCCKCASFDQCNCTPNNRVPDEEIQFLTDQRKDRRLEIAPITKDRHRAFKKRLEIRSLNGPQNPIRKTISPLLPKCNSPSPVVFENTRNNISLEAVATICDRYAISLRSAAAVTSAVLQDVGIIKSENRSQIIDKNKIHRALSKSRKKIDFHLEQVELFGLYFDGRKDKTLINEKENGRYHRKTILEEHISIIAEPNSKYLGHVIPKSGTGKEICDSMINFIKENNGRFDEIVCIGCDGTVTNTGWSGGVIRNVEIQLGRPLQWLICLLHTNELPFRHLLTALDGPTNGPKGYSGPIGVALTDCEKRSVVSFRPIVGSLPLISEDVVNDLSEDQKYLYKMCKVVESGHCPPQVADCQPGKMSHSRWLTTANRVLRLYVSSIKPSTNLKVLAKFIVMVYAPVWFLIKSKCSFENGALHLYKIMMWSRYLPKCLKAIIDPVIQRNAYFAHPENILVTMLFDARYEIRHIAMEHIKQARRNSDNSCVRIFKPPSLNFNANDYFDMIFWEDCQVTSPPVLRNISLESLELMIKTNNMKLPNFPSHTQSVERCIKSVTSASLCVIGSNARDGVIRNTIQSRTGMPSFHSKRYFNAE